MPQHTDRIRYRIPLTSDRQNPFGSLIHKDQGKIDALEQYLEENLSIFFSEDSYMSSVIKMGAEKSFTSHSAKIKDFLTRGIGGGTIMEGAGPTAGLTHQASSYSCKAYPMPTIDCYSTANNAPE